MPAMIGATLAFLQGWVFLYELLTWPFYLIFQSKLSFLPLKSISNGNGARLLARPVQNGGPWRNLRSLDELSKSMISDCITLSDLLIRAASIYGSKKALGTRQLLSCDMELQTNGKFFKKYNFGKYYWETFNDINKRVENFGKGLLKLKMKPEVSRVLIFSETRAEWMISAQACFRYNIPLVTLYATLGSEAIIHGIFESEASIVLTSEELMPTLCTVINQCPNIHHIIFMNNYIFERDNGEKVQQLKSYFGKVIPETIMIHDMSSIEKIGSSDTNLDGISDTIKATRNSLAIIMYTSGSTGKPKGVMMTHGNIMAAMAGQFESLPPIDMKSDIYIAYLPLAHVLELCCEMVVLSCGIPIGYSSPMTLTDNSSKIMSKTKGDITSLKPTIMACVPTILDRITKAVWEKVTDNGPLFFEIFRWAYNYKKNRMYKGYPSLFMDKIVFGRIKKLLGGRIRYMLSGGAPLNEEAQEFINICFCPIIQGYGLTETCGAGTIMSDGDRRVNHVGSPLSSVEILLRDWKEGNYSPFDLPKPRGEILIGGECVTLGYLNQPEKTKQDFIVDEKGTRWFCTGDIGMFHCDGSLSIIDRKKDLVKLQTGEYISLAKVELAISNHPIVEMVCVYVESTQSFSICIISAKQKQVYQLVDRLGIERVDFVGLCRNSKLISVVLKEIENVCLSRGLQRFEIPCRLFIDNNPWTPDTGLVTDAFKLKRREIQHRFADEISKMYNN